MFIILPCWKCSLVGFTRCYCKLNNAIGLDLQNNNSASTSRFFFTFLCRHCTTTTWKSLISRFVEEVHLTWDNAFLFPFLNLDKVLEFNTGKICQHLTKWKRSNKRDNVWSSTNSFFKWRFRRRCRSCCLSSLMTQSNVRHIHLLCSAVWHQLRHF